MQASYIKTLLSQWKNIMQENREKLIEMDSIVGDGDLGLTMSDGFTAAYEAIKDSAEHDIGKLLFQAGKAMANKVPSTMGTLMASGLMGAAKQLKGKTTLDADGITLLFQGYEEGVANLGKAKPGEKTFIDGLHPTISIFQKEVDHDIIATAKAAVTAAHTGYEETQNMLAVHGRAATRGEQSRTFKDPGAYVAYLLMKGYEKSLEGR